LLLSCGQYLNNAAWTNFITEKMNGYMGTSVDIMVRFYYEWHWESYDGSTYPEATQYDFFRFSYDTLNTDTPIYMTRSGSFLRKDRLQNFFSVEPTSWTSDMYFANFAELSNELENLVCGHGTNNHRLNTWFVEQS